DYKRAEISLRNTEAERKRVIQLLNYKYAYLKELIGLAPEQPLSLSFDYASMESELLLDTTLTLDYQHRVEYQQLQTQRQLQQLNTQYNKWAFLPRLSAFYNYAWDYRDDRFSDLFNQSFPRSVFGLSLNLPIFQGGKRIHEIRRSQLMEDRLDWDL